MTGLDVRFITMNLYLCWGYPQSKFIIIIVLGYHLDNYYTVYKLPPGDSQIIYHIISHNLGFSFDRQPLPLKCLRWVSTLLFFKGYSIFLTSYSIKWNSYYLSNFKNDLVHLSVYFVLWGVKNEEIIRTITTFQYFFTFKDSASNFSKNDIILLFDQTLSVDTTVSDYITVQWAVNTYKMNDVLNFRI